jgi:hypothetical protein
MVCRASCQRSASTAPATAPGAAAAAISTQDAITPAPVDEPGDAAQAAFADKTAVIEKKRALRSPATLVAVRAARHTHFDRIVFEFGAADLPGYHLEYTGRPIQQCGSGENESLDWPGRLVLRLMPARAHTEAGAITVPDRRRRLELAVLRELKVICDAEGVVEWAIGVAEPNAYRVLELRNPARIFIDIKH